MWTRSSAPRHPPSRRTWPADDPLHRLVRSARAGSSAELGSAASGIRPALELLSRDLGADHAWLRAAWIPTALSSSSTTPREPPTPTPHWYGNWWSSVTSNGSSRTPFSSTSSSLTTRTTLREPRPAPRVAPPGCLTASLTGAWAITPAQRCRGPSLNNTQQIRRYPPAPHGRY